MHEQSSWRAQIPGQVVSPVRFLQVFSIITLVVFPLTYLLLPYFVEMESTAGVGLDFLFYVLLIVALTEPAIYPLIERNRIVAVGRNPNSQMRPQQLYLTLSIVKIALVKAVYLYALVVFLVTGQADKMLWFYPIGLFWTAIYWPRESGLESFVERIEAVRRTAGPNPPQV